MEADTLTVQVIVLTSSQQSPVSMELGISSSLIYFHCIDITSISIDLFNFNLFLTHVTRLASGHTAAERVHFEVTWKSSH